MIGYHTKKRAFKKTNLQKNELQKSELSIILFILELAFQQQQEYNTELSQKLQQLHQQQVTMLKHGSATILQLSNHIHQTF